MVPERKQDGKFTKDRKIHGESNVWSTAQRQKKINGFDIDVGLTVTMDQMAIANSVHWYGHVLWREDGHVLRRALDFEVECHRKKWRLKRTLRK